MQFYTALYHALLEPSIFSDDNGDYLGFDDQIHRLPPDHAQYAELWTRRSWAARLATKTECFAVQLYRKSRIRLTRGQRFQGLAGAAISVALRPRLIQTRARIAIAALARGETA